MKKLRVSHFPQIGVKSFDVEVQTLEQALFLFEVLANYDDFQFKNRIKPDYCNTTAFEHWDFNDETNEYEWFTWYDEEGNEIENYELKDGKAVLKD